MLFSKRTSSTETLRIYCPVCSALLGTKKKDELKQFKCKECKATFYFYPGTRKKPRAVLDKKHNDKCGCGRTPWC